MVTLTLKRSSVDLKIKNPTLLITGDGRSLIDDLGKLNGTPMDVMNIGRSINVRQGQHWVNVDGPECKWWAEHLPGPPARHTIGECEGYDVIWDDGQPDGALWYGSSSLFATLIGLTMGYKAIILAGCPMDKGGHWFFGEEHKGPDWREEDYQAWREFAQTEEAKRVRSLSGFTKEVLDAR